jgi:hypothetical protein
MPSKKSVSQKNPESSAPEPEPKSSPHHKIIIAVAMADNGSYSAVGWGDGTPPTQDKLDSMFDAAAETLEVGDAFRLYLVEATLEAPVLLKVSADNVQEIGSDKNSKR